MYKIFKYSAILTLFFATSCKKNLPTIGGTASEKIANEWWVTLKANGEDLYGTHLKIATYNTSANNSEIWVDDYHNVWDFKVKAQADLNALTFNALGQKNEYYDITVDLKNGKILPKAGLSKSGNVTDSIYMEAAFSDDSTTTYTISGHARTRFIEDEY